MLYNTVTLAMQWSLIERRSTAEVVRNLTLTLKSE